mmetsp:Transcript_26595/g.50400  ORF Transcript_26595/g.50400 Transcript_26595/m.50400 type:complete len:80 (+) Transcript_26595:1065-1304(+)
MLNGKGGWKERLRRKNGGGRIPRDALTRLSKGMRREGREEEEEEEVFEGVFEGVFYEVEASDEAEAAYYSHTFGLRLLV